MSAVTHKRHLQALGIIPWVRRLLPADPIQDAGKPDESADPCYTRLNQPQSVLGTLLLEWTDGVMELSREHPGGQLLAAILGAVEQHWDRYQVLQLRSGSQPVAAEELPLAGSLVLCLTEHWQPPKGQQDGRDWLALPSLQQMLSDQQFKRQAWQQLKPWAEKLK